MKFLMDKASMRTGQVKNITVFLAAVLLTSLASAKTTIEYTVKWDIKIDGKYQQEMLLSKLNPKLARAGLPGFPEVVVFGRNDLPWAKKLRSMTDTAESKLGIEFQNVSPFGYTYIKDVEMCYRGDKNEVKDIIDAMTGPIFLEEQGIQAIRYGSKKHIYPLFKNDFFETNQDALESDLENNPDEVKKWKAHKASSANVLLLTDLGSQGDGVELYLSVIKPCK